jgi:hypothetical protein
MKLGRSGALVTAVVVILGAGQSREALAQEALEPEDRPCVEHVYVQPVQPVAAYHPVHHRHRHAAISAVDPAYVGVGERAPIERVGVPVEITASAGYAFTGGVPVQGGSLALAPSPVFGATVNVGYLWGARFEANYLLQNTGLQLQPNNGQNQAQYDVTAHHFRLGGEFDILHGRVRPFVGLLLGAEWLAPHSATPDELWFEASLEAGAKVRLTKQLGIRAQAEVTVVAMDSRSQVFCSNGCYPAWYGIGTSHLALTAGPTLGF